MTSSAVSSGKDARASNLDPIQAVPALFVVLWATGFIGARAGMPHAEPGTFLAMRFALALVLLAGIAFVLRAPWPRGRAAWGALVVGALVHGIYLGGVFWAVRHGMPAGVAAVIVGLQPVVTTALAGGWVGARLGLDERVGARHWVGLALGVVGVVLVLWPKLDLQPDLGLDVSGSGITPSTIGACALACLAVSLGTVLQKRVGATVDLRSGTALQYGGALVPVGLLALTETNAVSWTGELVFALLWLTLVLSLGAVFLLMWLIREGSVARVSALFFLVPTVAALMAWALYGEALGPIQIAGMALTAIAVWLGARRKE